MRQVFLFHRDKTSLNDRYELRCLCTLLYSKKFDKIYVGYTSDLIDRFKSHNYFATKGFTVKFRPWEVVYVEFFDDKAQALKREKELKSSRGRHFIKSTLIC